jgi:hypothetical protein
MMNRKADTDPIKVVVAVILVLFVLIIIITFAGDQLMDMLSGLAEFGEGVEEGLPDPSTIAGGGDTGE